jgi:AraC-like DNA-binding protein
MMSSNEDHVGFQEMTLGPGPGRQNAFDKFLELMSEFPVHCTYEYKGENGFSTQWVSGQRGAGTAIRWSCEAHTTKRTGNEIADSIPSGFGILYALSGGALLRQAGSEITVMPGAAVLYDLDQPLQVDMLSAPQREFFLVTLPPEKLLATPTSNESTFQPRLVTYQTPVLQCVDHLANALVRKDEDDFRPVFDACASLAMAEMLATEQISSPLPPSTNDLFEQIMDCIEIEIDNTELSAHWFANKYGVSVRYIHKLFASRGLTCRGYITAERLSHARQDLMSTATKIHIAALAHRWGFADAAAFVRAFRRRFGETPGKFRDKRRS